MDDDMIKIQLTIGNNPFPLTIRRSDEETVRKAARQVDNLTNAYKEHYPELPEVRILQMVAYQLSLEGLKEKGRNETTPYADKMQELANEYSIAVHENLRNTDYLSREQGNNNRRLVQKYYRQEAEKLVPDGEQRYDMILDLYYSNAINRQFCWDVIGDMIVEHVKSL